MKRLRSQSSRSGSTMLFRTRLSPRARQRQRLGIRHDKRTILFFGNIAPYKGTRIPYHCISTDPARPDDYQLIIAGRPKNCEKILDQQSRKRSKKTSRADEYCSGRTTFLMTRPRSYFKAADVLVLPYRHIYQSGVLFLGYSFGLPVIAADVGSLQDEIVEGKTGFVFRPEDPTDLAKTIERYFASDLFADLKSRRPEIREYAKESHSWDRSGPDRQ